jgi:hypothetical protein
LGILFSSILCTCPNQRNLCSLIVSVMVGTISMIIPVTSHCPLQVGALSSSAASTPLQLVLTSTQLHEHRSASNSSFLVIYAQAILPLSSIFK